VVGYYFDPIAAAVPCNSAVDNGGDSIVGIGIVFASSGAFPEVGMIGEDTPEVGSEGIGLEWRVVARQWSGPGQMEWSYLVDDIDGLKVGMYETRRITAVTGPMGNGRGYVLYAKIAARR
jgi:hypothetical protein